MEFNVQKASLESLSGSWGQDEGPDGRRPHATVSWGTDKGLPLHAPLRGQSSVVGEPGHHPESLPCGALICLGVTLVPGRCFGRGVAVLVERPVLRGELGGEGLQGGGPRPTSGRRTALL